MYAAFVTPRIWCRRVLRGGGQSLPPLTIRRIRAGQSEQPRLGGPDAASVAFAVGPEEFLTAEAGSDSTGYLAVRQPIRTPGEVIRGGEFGDEFIPLAHLATSGIHGTLRMKVP